MAYISWLDACDDPAAAGVGGKGGSLIHLRRGGFAVPQGFVVGAAGYQAWVQHNVLRPHIEALLASPDLHLPGAARAATAAIKRAIDAAGLPPALQQAVLTAYHELGRRRGRGVVTAVRSSALSEDGAASSSAGLYETYLNVRDEAAVLDGLVGCYRSLWAQRAVQYRAFRQLDSRREAMGVVIMEMIPAHVSGIAFTVNPVTGNADEVMINASWGLGEAIVSGRVTPDSFLVRKQDLQILARDIYDKELMIVPDPSGASSTVAIDVPAENVRTPALSDEQAVELARLCLQIEQYYGRPQDIEWAFHEGQLYVLQSRPVTGLG